MRVLWITNNPLPNFIARIVGKPATGGSWISPLAYGLSNQADIQLAVVTNVPGGVYQKLESDSIIQYLIPIKKKGGLIVNDLYPELIKFYQDIEHEFKPDIIHIHGTERYFGLLSARKLLSAPVVISIQGIINSYYDFLLGGIEEMEIRRRRSVKNILGKGGIINQRNKYRKYMQIEKEILRKNTYFFCRTTWDRSQIFMFNNNNTMFQGEELLRQSFYNMKWSLQKIQRHSIFISSGTIPIKGLHVLLKAANILKYLFPNLLLRIPLDKNIFFRKSRLLSNDYEMYLNELISQNDLTDNLQLMGTLDEFQMADCMASSHVFVLPSFMENSPNSLGEAMMVGTPTVVSPVGGVPDMVQNNESALYASPGDSAMLAYRIKQIFDDDKLATCISEKAKVIAGKRHDVTSTIWQYKTAYQIIIEKVGMENLINDRV